MVHQLAYGGILISNCEHPNTLCKMTAYTFLSSLMHLFKSSWLIAISKSLNMGGYLRWIEVAKTKASSKSRKMVGTLNSWTSHGILLQAYGKDYLNAVSK